MKKIQGLTEKALQQADLLNRTQKTSSIFLEIGESFANASQKALGAVIGGSVCIIALNVIPSSIPPLTKFLLSPIAGSSGAALGALITPVSKGERRRRELKELEEGWQQELKELETKMVENPELIEIYQPLYERLLDGYINLKLSSPSSRSQQSTNILPPSDERNFS